APWRRRKPRCDGAGPAGGHQDDGRCRPQGRMAAPVRSGRPQQQPAIPGAQARLPVQELAYGGPSRETVRLLDALADELQGKPGRKAMLRESRMPVAGTRLVREWNGVEHTVTVLRDGFEFEGRKYKSLSAIARAIAGTRWNGWRFFGLRE